MTADGRIDVVGTKVSEVYTFVSARPVEGW